MKKRICRAHEYKITFGRKECFVFLTNLKKKAPVLSNQHQQRTNAATQTLRRLMTI